MSAGEIIIILFVYLFFFGAKGLPSLAQTLGKAVYQFRNATQDIQREIMDGANEIKKQAQANVKLDQMDIDLDEPKANSVPQTPAAPPTPPPPPPPAQEMIDKRSGTFGVFPFFFFPRIIRDTSRAVELETK